MGLFVQLVFFWEKKRKKKFPGHVFSLQKYYREL